MHTDSLKGVPEAHVRMTNSESCNTYLPLIRDSHSPHIHSFSFLTRAGH